MTTERVEALRAALKLVPESHALRVMLADLLAELGHAPEAYIEYRTLLDADQLPRESLLQATDLAMTVGDLDAATRCIDAARAVGIVEGLAERQARLDTARDSRGAMRAASSNTSVTPLPIDEILEQSQQITFSDIGGLDEIKKVINRMIILPMQRPELYRQYRRQAGGGVLLYGPPGCGKTILARATAGECNLPFFNIRIEGILDPYIGISERNLHDAFALARQYAPCVVFFDEIDALAFARRKHQGGAGRSLVDQMLQELDAIGSENQEILFLAATNAPWDVDDALLRPGRFDRRIFVPPPDMEARRRILELYLHGLPKQEINTTRLAQSTPLFSGADLRGLIERATDEVIEEALDTGGSPPLKQAHLEKALRGLRPTTLEWLARARNYVEFSNRDERYKEVASFLSSREARAYEF